MAGATRTRFLLRWPAGLAALTIALAAAGSAPLRAEPDDAARYAQCEKTAQQALDEYRDAGDPSVVFTVAVICERPDGTPIDPRLWSPAAPIPPAPTPATTAGRPGCVTGPGRPVVGTTLTSATATTGHGEAIVYEYQRLDGGETTGSSGSGILEFGPGDLAPGGSYRWRARLDDPAFGERPANDERGWSPWCEFTVSADAVDYRGLGDVSLEALHELGLRPDRKYPVSLSARQQRLLREGTNVGRTSARMTLTGPRWTDLLVQLTAWALIVDETALEDESSPSDGPAYRALTDAISVKLGGPRHPRLS